MKKHRGPRRRGNSERSDENLRGRNRELEKQLESANRYARSLEKKIERLLGGAPGEKPNGTVKKKLGIEKDTNCCTNCGKGEIKETEIWTPAGEIVWLVCQLCKARERKK